jgi:hypothetical protein
MLVQLQLQLKLLGEKVRVVYKHTMLVKDYICIVMITYKKKL